jgi:hypothetical protein
MAYRSRSRNRAGVGRAAGINTITVPLRTSGGVGRSEKGEPRLCRAAAPPFPAVGLRL